MDFCGCRLVGARWLKSGGDQDAAELGQAAERAERRGGGQRAEGGQQAGQRGGKRSRRVREHRPGTRFFGGFVNTADAPPFFTLSPAVSQITLRVEIVPDTRHTAPPGRADVRIGPAPKLRKPREYLHAAFILIRSSWAANPYEHR